MNILKFVFLFKYVCLYFLISSNHYWLLSQFLALRLFDSSVLLDAKIAMVARTVTSTSNSPEDCVLSYQTQTWPEWSLYGLQPGSIIATLLQEQRPDPEKAPVGTKYSSPFA